MKKLLIFISFLLGISYCESYAQKVFVPAVQEFVTVESYENDIYEDLTKYSGDYIFVYPGYDEFDQSEGNAYVYLFRLKVTNKGADVKATRSRQNLGSDESKTKTLENASIIKNEFNSEELSGKFVIIKFKYKKLTKSASGFLVKHKSDSGFDFYEKQ